MLNFRTIIKTFIGAEVPSSKGKEKLRPNVTKETSFSKFRKNWLSKKKKRLPKQLSLIQLSDLEFKLLTKKPLLRSSLNKAIHAAGQIHYNPEENSLDKNGVRIQRQTKSDDQEVNVYVKADLSFSPNGLMTMLDLCTELNNR